jgi:hypothetical protein
MYLGYTGRYPRMQLWHGTTDTTLAYPNFGEEMKQWTNLHVSIAGVGHSLPMTGQLAYAISFLGLDH